MSQDVNGPFTLKADGALTAYTLAKLSTTARDVATCGAGERPIGVVLKTVADNEQVAIAPLNKFGSHRMTANGAISYGALVYPAASGKVSSSAVGDPVGIAMEATTADGDIFEVAPLLAANVFGNIAAVHTLQDDFDYYSDGDLWVAVNTDGGAVTETDAAGGVISLAPSDATVGDNDESYINSANEIFNLVTAGKDLIAECKLQLTEANTDDANIIFGVSDTVGANFLLDNGGGPAASYDGAVIFKVDGGTVWQGESSNAGTQATDTSIGAFTSGAATTLRITALSNTGDTTATVTYYVNGVSGGSTTLTLAGLEEMHVIAGVKNGGANEETLLIDYIQVTQLR